MKPPELPPRAPVSDGGIPPRHLELAFPCVQCGAPVVAPDEDVTVACRHCGSLLFLAGGTGPRPCCIEPTVRDAAGLKWVLVTRRLAEFRARLMTDMREASVLAARAGDVAGELLGGDLGRLAGAVLRGGLAVQPSGDGSPFFDDMVLTAQLEAEARRLDGAVRIGAHRILWAPYWHRHGLVAHAVLGRARGSRKELAVAGFWGEASLPAYDVSRYNLRDRGLRMTVTRARLLSRRDRAAGFGGLPVVAPREEDAETLRGWLHRDRVPDLDPLAKRVDLLGARWELLYRPLVVTQFVEPQGESWMLVDAQFGLIGGALDDPAEREVLLAAPSVDPFSTASEATIVLVASRCVECGLDLPHEPRAWIRTCPRCRVGLGVGTGGLVRTSYAHALLPGVDRHDWLPFWRFRMRLTTRGGAVLERPAEVGATLLPAKAARRVVASELFVPAVRLLGTPGGDRAFAAACEWAHRAPLDVRPEAIHADEGGEAVPASVSEAEAEELGRAALCAALEHAVVQRLTLPSFRDVMVDSTLELSHACLVFVPAQRVAEGWTLPGGPTIATLLVEGGEALDLMRQRA